MRRVLDMGRVILVLCVLTACTGGCGGAASGSQAGAVEPNLVSTAIERSTGYLIAACDEKGRFRYRVNLNPNLYPRPGYNLLRHCGAMYALSMAYRHETSPEALAAMQRAETFLREEALGPIPGESREMLAVWSHPQVTRTGALHAKLGGAGLGLLALGRLEQIESRPGRLEDLQRLGRFILFMQREDGGFHSRFLLSSGLDDSWASLYYPGEAALGLVTLYEIDGDRRWLDAAARAIGYLARIREGESTVEPDHWTLLATAKLLEHFDAAGDLPVSRDVLIGHAVQICTSMMEQRYAGGGNPLWAGCFTSDGRTCPTAARLEGLIASLEFLGAERGTLRRQIEGTVHEGMAFLVRAQVPSGEYAGALPGVIRPFDAEGTPLPSSLDPDATEVRIDYVQHALSAMIQYHCMFAR